MSQHIDSFDEPSIAVGVTVLCGAGAGALDYGPVVPGPGSVPRPGLRPWPGSRPMGVSRIWPGRDSVDAAAVVAGGHAVVGRDVRHGHRLDHAVQRISGKQR